MISELQALRVGAGVGQDLLHTLYEFRLMELLVTDVHRQAIGVATSRSLWIPASNRHDSSSTQSSSLEHQSAVLDIGRNSVGEISPGSVLPAAIAPRRPGYGRRGSSAPVADRVRTGGHAARCGVRFDAQARGRDLVHAAFEHARPVTSGAFRVVHRGIW